jgi:proteic killer suppression protein
MIVSIRHKGLKLLWEKGDASKLPSGLINRIAMILQLINSARKVEDVNFPGSNLHPLKGELAGFWAVKIQINFSFCGGGVFSA